MNLLCKVTSRERPNELIKCLKTYIDLCNDKTRLKWLFSFDIDDKFYNNTEFLNLIYELIPEAVIYFGESKSKIEAINRDIEKVKNWDILVNISDDQLAIVKDWDIEIIKAMPEHLDASLWFNDGHQSILNTMEIVGKAYFDRFKYIYYPVYKSFFCDNEAMEVAQKLGKLIKIDKCIIKHFHYVWEKHTHMKKDNTYIKAEEFWGFDKSLFSQRKALNYDL